MRRLRRTIDEGAEEIEMVSAESVFSKPLSRTLIRSARKLHLVARDLNRLVRLIEQARVPKAPKPLKLKPKLRNRRQAGNRSAMHRGL